MRRAWLGVRCAVCLLLTVSGCMSFTPQRHVIKAPPHEEEYNIPPDDVRFSNPPQYPKGTLNKDNHKKDDDDDQNGKMRLGGPGGGSNMSAGY